MKAVPCISFNAFHHTTAIFLGNHFLLAFHDHFTNNIQKLIKFFVRVCVCVCVCV